MPKLAIERNMLRSVSRGNDPNSVAVSNNVPPQSRFSILDLESGTKYELRVTAYNNAGSTQAEYLFSTLSPTGSNRMHDEQPPETEETSLFFDAHVLAPSVISLLAVFLAVAGVCFCLKTRKSAPAVRLQICRSFSSLHYSHGDFSLRSFGVLLVRFETTNRINLARRPRC